MAPQKKMGLGGPRLLPGPKSALGTFFGVPEKRAGGEAAFHEEYPSHGRRWLPGVLGELLEALGIPSGSSGAPAEPPRWGLATAPRQGRTFCDQFPNRSVDWRHKQGIPWLPTAAGWEVRDAPLGSIPKQNLKFRAGKFQELSVFTSQNFFVLAPQSLPGLGRSNFASSLPRMAPFGVSQKNLRIPTLHRCQQHFSAASNSLPALLGRVS